MGSSTRSRVADADLKGKADLKGFIPAFSLNIWAPLVKAVHYLPVTRRQHSASPTIFTILTPVLLVSTESIYAA